MLVTVYRLRELGKRLPKPAAPVRGELNVFGHGSMWRTTKKLRAEVIAHDEAALPPLQHAWVAKITRQGIVIMGTEYVARRASAKSRVDSYAQTWWCRVDASSVINQLICEPVAPDADFELG